MQTHPVEPLFLRRYMAVRAPLGVFSDTTLANSSSCCTQHPKIQGPLSIHQHLAMSSRQERKDSTYDFVAQRSEEEANYWDGDGQRRGGWYTPGSRNTNQARPEPEPSTTNNPTSYRSQTPHKLPTRELTTESYKKENPHRPPCPKAWSEQATCQCRPGGDGVYLRQNAYRRPENNR